MGSNVRARARVLIDLRRISVTKSPGMVTFRPVMQALDWPQSVVPPPTPQSGGNKSASSTRARKIPRGGALDQTQINLDQTQKNIPKTEEELQAEIETLRSVAAWRQSVLSDCLAEQRRLTRADRQWADHVKQLADERDRLADGWRKEITMRQKLRARLTAAEHVIEVVKARQIGTSGGVGEAMAAYEALAG